MFMHPYMIPGGFDTSYLVFLVIAISLPAFAQMKLTSTFNRFLRVRSGSGMTGASVARRILDRNGLHEVQVVETGGRLSDHYDPRRKTVRLSRDIYHGSSVASVAVAAHECGHALQHAQAYAPLQMRTAIVPAVNIANRFGFIAIMIGLMLEGFTQLAWIGVILIGLTVVFQLITLPVEFNASSRAMVQMQEMNVLYTDEETRGARKVLSAAALTYVAATIVALAQLLRFVLIILNNQGRRRR